MIGFALAAVALARRRVADVHDVLGRAERRLRHAALDAELRALARRARWS